MKSNHLESFGGEAGHNTVYPPPSTNLTDRSLIVRTTYYKVQYVFSGHFKIWVDHSFTDLWSWPGSLPAPAGAPPILRQKSLSSPDPTLPCPQQHHGRRAICAQNNACQDFRGDIARAPWKLDRLNLDPAIFDVASDWVVPLNEGPRSGRPSEQSRALASTRQIGSP